MAAAHRRHRPLVGGLARGGYMAWSSIIRGTAPAVPPRRRRRRARRRGASSSSRRRRASTWRAGSPAPKRSGGADRVRRCRVGQGERARRAGWDSAHRLPRARHGRWHPRSAAQSDVRRGDVPDVGARHRRQHRDVHRRQRGASSSAAVCAPRRSRAHLDRRHASRAARGANCLSARSSIGAPTTTRCRTSPSTRAGRAPLGNDGTREMTRAAYVSGNLFSVLGTRPALGRPTRSMMRTAPRPSP